MPPMLILLFTLFGGNLLFNQEPARVPPAWFLRMDGAEQGEWLKVHDFKYHLRYGIESHCGMEVERGQP